MDSWCCNEINKLKEKISRLDRGLLSQQTSESSSPAQATQSTRYVMETASVSIHKSTTIGNKRLSSSFFLTNFSYTAIEDLVKGLVSGFLLNSGWTSHMVANLNFFGGMSSLMQKSCSTFSQVPKQELCMWV